MKGFLQTFTLFKPVNHDDQRDAEEAVFGYVSLVRKALMSVANDITANLLGYVSLVGRFCWLQMTLWQTF